LTGIALSLSLENWLVIELEADALTWGISAQKSET
jgi:hypothetical protein